jgi:diguanylate cyclase (GGDEF)-like protein
VSFRQPVEQEGRLIHLPGESRRNPRRAAAERAPLLVIEDRPGDAELVQALLRRSTVHQVFDVTAVPTLAEAMPLLDEAACVLLDLALPDAEGLDGLRTVRLAAPNVPVVVLTGYADEDLGLEALRQGAQDYLVKGEIDGRQLTRTIRYAMERAQAEARMQYLAFHDVLTGLVNRTLFTDRLGHALDRMARGDVASAALLALDLDHFKLVNDSLGHKAGDDLLVAVGDRLRSIVRPADTVARLGGDEFAILCEGIDGSDQAISVARRVLDSLAPPFAVAGHEVFVHASAGLVIVGSNNVAPERLLTDVDIALYSSKERGRGRLELFSDEMRTHLNGTHVTRTDLHHAVERDELRLVYQPLVDLRTGDVTGVEALLRWAHPQRGLLSPADFLVEAEATGLIIPIGAWVLATALRDLSSWRRSTGHDVGVAVNLSASQLADAGLVELVIDTLRSNLTDASALSVEITETALLRDVEGAARDLDALRRLGVHVAIDDFGIGYSSLDYLRRLPVDILKIDRTFVSGVGRSEQSTAIVATLTAMASSLRLTVVAEGVETVQQLATLRDLGCGLAQGYHLSRPIPAEEVPRLLSTPIAAARTSAGR